MKKVLSVTIEEDIINKLQTNAEKENRSLSNYTETIIIKALEE